MTENCISQIKLGEKLTEDGFYKEGIINNRRFCIAASTLMCTNHQIEKKLGIGFLAKYIEEIFKIHGQYNFVYGEEKCPMNVYSEKFEMFRHTLLPIPRSQNLEAEIIRRVKVEDIKRLVQDGCSVALSVKNSFIQEVSGTEVELVPGGHVVAILGTNEEEKFVIVDPYYAGNNEPKIVLVSPDKLGEYSRGEGIVVSKKKIDITEDKILNIKYSPELQKKIDQIIVDCSRQQDE